MRIALAQIDVVVGDIAGNAERCIAAITHATDAGVDLTLLPEMAITGYPPEDLLIKTHFVEENRAALDRVAATVTHGRALVGFVDTENGARYNAAAKLGDGRVMSIYHKRKLPNYGVFDEERWFHAGVAPLFFDVTDERVSCTVCEDIWTPELAAEAADAGARIIVNISASPFHVGKGAEREAMLRRRARDNCVWLAYCNLVGAQDELVFDGQSLIIAPNGVVVARAAAFEEELLIHDIEVGSLSAGARPCSSKVTPVVGRVAPQLEEANEVYDALVVGVRDYLGKNGFSDAVIGLSGGIDSALTAVVATDALGPEHVHGVLMPSRYSSTGSVDDAKALAEALGIETRTLPIEGPFAAYLAALEEPIGPQLGDLTEQNLQARVRGMLLMALSNEFGWIVLATGNKSELSVGYSTLYGDMVGGFAPLKDVFKTRVYQLAKWRNAHGPHPLIPEATLTKPPSAELRPDQVDQDSLPPYDVLDAILEGYVEGDWSQERITTDHGFDPGLVARVCHMVDRAEYKRRQGPLGIKITPKAFGRDRRMPVTNRYDG